MTVFPMASPTPQELLQKLQAALAADVGALKYLEGLSGGGVATVLMQVRHGKVHGRPDQGSVSGAGLRHALHTSLAVRERR